MQNRVPSPRHADVGAAGRTHQRAVAADKPLKKLAANFKYASATIGESLLHSYSKRFERRYRDMFDISDSYWLLCQGYADRLARLLGVKRQSEDKSNAKPGRYRPVYAACKLREKERGAVCRPSDICRQTR